VQANTREINNQTNVKPPQTQINSPQEVIHKVEVRKRSRNETEMTNIPGAQKTGEAYNVSKINPSMFDIEIEHGFEE
jgi:hypothetical protein